MSPAAPDGGRGFIALLSQSAGEPASGASRPVETRLWWVRHAPVAHGGRIYDQIELPCDCSDTAVFTGFAEKRLLRLSSA